MLFRGKIRCSIKYRVLTDTSPLVASIRLVYSITQIVAEENTPQTLCTVYSRCCSVCNYE